MKDFEFHKRKTGFLGRNPVFLGEATGSTFRGRRAAVADPGPATGGSIGADVREGVRRGVAEGQWQPARGIQKAREGIV